MLYDLFKWYFYIRPEKRKTPRRGQRGDYFKINSEILSGNKIKQIVMNNIMRIPLGTIQANANNINIIIQRIKVAGATLHLRHPSPSPYLSILISSSLKHKYSNSHLR